MRELDEKLDEDTSFAKQLVEYDNKNRLAWEELEYFNKSGDFKWKHPILQQKHSIKQLVDLKKKDPKGFLDKYTNANKNITRYQSQLTQKKYDSEEEKQRIEQNLYKHTQQSELMASLLNEYS